MGEIFTAVGGTPIPTLLMIMGFFLITFSTLLRFKEDHRKKTFLDIIGGRDKLYWPGLLVGVVFFGVGLFYQPIMAAQTPPTPTVTPTPAAAASETPLPAASATALPPAIETPAVAATATATTAPSPMPVLTIKNGCIFAPTWKAASSGVITLSNNPDPQGCLSLDAAGMMADKFGVLHLRQTAKRSPLAAGIYTPIGDTSVIEFKVFIKSFYIINADAPAAINFAVAPAADPLNSLHSARFKLSVDSADRTVHPPYIYFVLANLGETNGNKVPTQHYEYQYTYAIRIELTGAIIRVYINDNQMTKDLSMPPGQKVFFIGYNLPTLADADVQISDIRVDGVEK